MTDQAKVDPQEAFLANPFIAAIRQHNAGHSADLLGKALQQLVKAVKKHRKLGKLEIKLSIDAADEPDHDGNTLVDVVIDYSIKAPTETIPKRLMYTTDTDTLSNDDPKQLRIEGL